MAMAKMTVFSHSDFDPFGNIYTNDVLDILKASQHRAKKRKSEVTVELLLTVMFKTNAWDSSSYLRKLVERSSSRHECTDLSFYNGLKAHEKLQRGPGYSRDALIALRKANGIRIEYGDSYIGMFHLLLSVLGTHLWHKDTKGNESYAKAVKSVAVNMKNGHKISSRTADCSSYGYIVKHCEDMTEQIRQGEVKPALAREDDIRRFVGVLCKRARSSIVLVNGCSFSKLSLVHGAVKRIIECGPPHLQDCKFISLNAISLEYHTRNLWGFEDGFNDVLDYLRRSERKVILFVEGVHCITSNRATAVSFRNAIASGQLQCICTTTPSEFHNEMASDCIFENYFQRVDIADVTVSETLTLLRHKRSFYEKSHGVRILDSTLVAAAHLAARYISSSKMPLSAMDLVDEAAASFAIKQAFKPKDIAILDERLRMLEVETETLKKDIDVDYTSRERLETVRKQKTDLENALTASREEYYQDGDIRRSMAESEFDSMFDTGCMETAKVAKKTLVKRVVRPDAVFQIISSMLGVSPDLLEF
ncbi:putative chaperone ATPase [Clavispora lusitaniae]|uniref:Chaperone ATPase n=1 Tax=Clavispora lusitaniae TaxID=36911 RepID=A0AA91T0E8_CLALS|nr:putative chaperone ATPase [Clavispora lusitaniae]